MNYYINFLKQNQDFENELPNNEWLINAQYPVNGRQHDYFKTYSQRNN